MGPDLNQSVFTLPAAVGTTTFPQVFHRGYIESTTSPCSATPAPDSTCRPAYVGSRAIRQTVIQNINAAGPGGGNTGRALFPQFGRISDISYFTPFNTAKYNGLQTQVTRRFGGLDARRVLHAVARYRLCGRHGFGGLTWNWVPMLQRNKAVAGFDRTHNLQFYGNYDLPFGTGKKYARAGLVRGMAGGWQVELDPEPDQRHAVHGRHFGHVGERARQHADGRPGPAGRSRFWAGMESASPTSIRIAFAPVTDVRFGNSGRNILRGPGVFNLDGSVFRDFRMTERFGLQFRAEMFGVTNTPQFNNPGATVSPSTTERRWHHSRR